MSFRVADVHRDIPLNEHPVGRRARLLEQPGWKIEKSGNRAPCRRYRHLENAMPIAGDATVAARIDQTRPCTMDESLMRNGH